MSDPRRILDDAHEPAELREMVRCGVGVAPSDSDVASLAARLGLPGPPPEGGAGDSGATQAPKGPGPPPPAGPKLRPVAAGRWGAAVGAGVVLLGVVGSLVISPSVQRADRALGGASSALMPRVAAPASASAAAPAASSVDVAVRPSPREQRPRGEPASGAAAAASTSKDAPGDPLSESRMLRRARRLLSSDPAASLAITREHRRRFPNGTLAQEREVLAIEALARMGKKDEASDRADAFRKSHPDSAHGDKVETSLQ